MRSLSCRLGLPSVTEAHRGTLSILPPSDPKQGLRSPEPEHAGGEGKGDMNPTDLHGRLPESRAIWSPFVIQGRKDGREPGIFIK